MFNRWRLVALVVVSAITLAAALVAPAADADGKPDALEIRLQSLKDERAHVSQQVWDGTLKLYLQGSASLAEILVVMNAQSEAQMAAAKSPKELIAACLKLVEASRQIEEAVEARLNAGRNEFPINLDLAKANRLSAEINLTKAKISAARTSAAGK